MMTEVGGREQEEEGEEERGQPSKHLQSQTFTAQDPHEERTYGPTLSYLLIFGWMRAMGVRQHLLE